MTLYEGVANGIRDRDRLDDLARFALRIAFAAMISRSRRRLVMHEAPHLRSSFAKRSSLVEKKHEAGWSIFPAIVAFGATRPTGARLKATAA